MEPLALSIVVPVYNTESYLPACLEALSSQEGIYRYEVILVDDASTDSSANVIAAFQASHPEIFRSIKRSENGGLCAARNDGMRAAQGEWIAFVDSDDIPHRDYVLTLMRTALCHEEVDVACAGFQLMDSQGREHSSPARAYSGRLYPEAAAIKLLHDSSVRSFVWDKCFRRSFLEKNRIGFYSFRTGFEDLPFVFSSFLSARMVAFSRKVCYTYRNQREGSLTRGGLGERRLIDHLCSYFACRGFADFKIGVGSASKMFRKVATRIRLTLMADVPSQFRKVGFRKTFQLLGRWVKLLSEPSLQVFGAPWERHVLAYSPKLETFTDFRGRTDRGN